MRQKMPQTLAAKGHAGSYKGRWQLQRMLNTVQDAAEDAAGGLSVTEDVEPCRGRCKGRWQLQKTLGAP